MASATQTIPEREATIAGALDLTAPALIGVFGTDDRRRALVRSAQGRVRHVEPGDRLLGGRVATIEPDGLVIARRSGVLRLDLAGHGTGP